MYGGEDEMGLESTLIRTWMPSLAVHRLHAPGTHEREGRERTRPLAARDRHLHRLAGGRRFRMRKREHVVPDPAHFAPAGDRDLFVAPGPPLRPAAGAPPGALLRRRAPETVRHPPRPPPRHTAPRR